MFGDAFGWGTLATRMGVALLAGAAVGWDRQRAGKPAGLRTHMLVSLGACVFVLVPLGLGAREDALSRTIQGIATGIGFLGAGEIMHNLREGHKDAQVKGLTSAAALWLTAALGIVSACGLWRTALLAGVAAVVVLTAVKRLESLLFPSRPEDDST